jgi:ribosome-binding protein aMBF1 (putative translation factor)
METIVEVVFPEDFIGGVAQSSEPDSTVRMKVDTARRYIARQIRKRRDELGITQVELANRAGIPQSHVSRLEGGKHAPTKITIERVAEALGIRPSLLDPGYSDESDDARRR